MEIKMIRHLYRWTALSLIKYLSLRYDIKKTHKQLTEQKNIQFVQIYSLFVEFSIHCCTDAVCCN